MKEIAGGAGAFVAFPVSRAELITNNAVQILKKKPPRSVDGGRLSLVTPRTPAE